MQKSLTCLAYFIVSLTFCTAQSTKKDTTAFRPHWEIGVDLLPLIDKENVPANTIFARRNYFLENGRGKAWRMRAGVEIEKRDFIDVGRISEDEFRTFEPNISIGHEWQYINKGYRWFVGLEGNGSYYRHNFNYLAVPVDKRREKGFIEEYKIGVSAILGFQVKLPNNLWLSSETSLNSLYKRYHLKSNTTLSDGTPLTARSEDLEKKITVGIHPIFVINLIYSLKSTRHDNKKT